MTTRRKFSEPCFLKETKEARKNYKILKTRLYYIKEETREYVRNESDFHNPLNQTSIKTNIDRTSLTKKKK